MKKKNNMKNNMINNEEISKKEEIKKKKSMRNISVTIIGTYCCPIKFFVCLIFIFLLLIGEGYAETACDVATKLDFSSSGAPTSADSNWKSLSIIALAVSTLLISAVYMFGKLSDNINLINKAKTDLTQVITTALILILFSVFVVNICNINASQFGIKGETLFDSTKNYFEYAESVALDAYVKMSAALMLSAGLSGFYVQSGAIPLGLYYSLSFSFSPFSVAGVAVLTLQTLMNLILLSISIAKAYAIVTEIIFLSSLNLLLPTGVLLRCFTPTREVGGILIGLSIGLFVFYPLIFSLSYLMIGQPEKVDIQPMDWYSSLISYAVLFSAVSSMPSGQTITYTSMFLSVIKDTENIIFDAFESVGKTLLPVFILPAINWIIIAMIIRSMTKSLGAEIDISALARMI